MATLVLLAHGSEINPDSGASCRSCAATIEALGLFDEVRVGFWKESPSWRAAIEGAQAEPVFVAPFFLSDGHYVRTVIPRELAAIGRDVVVCEAVGTDPRMQGVILARAEASLDGSAPVEAAALVLVGHGTPRNRRSTERTWSHVHAIRALGRFAEVTAVFTDDVPQVAEALERVEARDVVVVPVMTAEGYHTRQTIPEDLGVAPEGPWPVEAGGRRIWIAAAIGTAPEMVDVVLAKVREAGWVEKPSPD